MTRRSFIKQAWLACLTVRLIPQTTNQAQHPPPYSNDYVVVRGWILKKEDI